MGRIGSDWGSEDIVNIYKDGSWDDDGGRHDSLEIKCNQIYYFYYIYDSELYNCLKCTATKKEKINIETRRSTTPEQRVILVQGPC